MKLKISDLLKYDITPFLFGVFYSRIMNEPKDDNIPERFYVYSSFRRSKVVYRSTISFVNYIPKLIESYNFFSGYFNWGIFKLDEDNVEIRFYVINDLNINVENFSTLIYRKLLNSAWIYEDILNSHKKDFIRGYMETRGSVDTTLKLIAQDYFYNNSFELKRIQVLTDLMNLPISYANFNPRNMQPDYVTGRKKRNAQFRINLFFYSKIVGYVNEYKAMIFEKAYSPQNKIIKNGVIYYDVEIPKINSSIAFIKYLNFYTNNIYNKDLTKEKIYILREEIGFNYSDSNAISRDRKIIDLFEEISEDKCALCGTNKTFIKKSNGRQSFEIHHMIPFHNGKEYDNIANLVKLCPTCHRKLKKGSSTKTEQIKGITTILHNHPEVYEYASAILGINNIVDLSDEIWTMLG